MIYINPQWQGSGKAEVLKEGALNIGKYLSRDFTLIPLSDKPLTTINNIIAYDPLLEQLRLFRGIIAENKPKKITMIAGDCAAEIMPISYLNCLYRGDLLIVWMDAHGDINTPKSSPSKTFHGMPVRTLLGEGDDAFTSELFSFIKPEQLCFVGLKDLDEPEAIYIEEKKIKSLESGDFKATEAFLKASRFSKAYIHIDLDVLDKNECPYTLFQTTNGASIEEILKTINLLKATFEVVGMSVTESTATTLEQLKPIEKLLKEVII